MGIFELFQLGFTPMLEKLGMNPTAIATAQVMVANRLIEPPSEWALIDSAQRTALPELLDVRLSKTTKDRLYRLYRVSDELLKHCKLIETALRGKSQDLFSLNRSVILYDVTNTHFEGVCSNNPKAKHGKNKQKRRLKEVAMISSAEQRFLKDSEALQARVAKGRLKRESLIERAIGKLLKKHPKVARFYQLTHESSTLRVERDDARHEAAIDLCGDYVLKTDHSLEGPELWKLYMTLLRAEEGFGALKGALGLRPNFHQLEGRVEGHIFISILAYHLLCWVGHRLTQSGDVRDWQTLRRLLRTLSLVTTRLPLEDGRVIEIRKPSLPDPEQAFVYRRIGIYWKTSLSRQEIHHEMKPN